MDTFPDLGALSDQELKDLIQELTAEEREVSYQRRLLHGKIDILRAELVNRLRTKHEEGEPIITGADVRQLTEILGGRGESEDDNEDGGSEKDNRDGASEKDNGE
jgi:hypothetical protein